MPEPCHEFLERRAGRRRQGGTGVAEIVNVQVRLAYRFARLAPDRLVEVRAAKPAALGPDKDEPSLSCGESLRTRPGGNQRFEG